MLLEQIEAKQHQKQVEHLREELRAKQARIVELARRVETLEDSLKAAQESLKGARKRPVGVPLEAALSFASESVAGAKVVGVKIAPELRARIDVFKAEHKISSARHAVLALLFIATRMISTTTEIDKDANHQTS